MKKLFKILSLLLVSLVSTQSFARVDFIFTHIAPTHTVTSIEAQPALLVYAISESHAHVAADVGLDSLDDPSKYRHQGDSSLDYVMANFFAPDPTGLYQVTFRCYLPKFQQFTQVTREIVIEKNSGVVQIQASCPVSLQGDQYVLQQPSDISIKITP